MSNAGCVRPGQVYEDCNEKRAARRIVIITIEGRYARCLSFNFAVNEIREVKILVSRFIHPDSRAYKLCRQYSYGMRNRG